MTAACSFDEFSASCAEIPPRVLVIDDEPLVCWSLVAGFRHAGFEAGAVDSPEETRQFVDSPPDVVLLDVRLWGSDPPRLLEQLGRLWPKCKVLLLAVEGQEVPPACRNLGVVRKPFDLAAVVRRVQDLLSGPPDGVRMAV